MFSSTTPDTRKKINFMPTKTRILRFAGFKILRLLDVLLREIELKELHLASKGILQEQDRKVEEGGWTRRKFRVIKLHE